MRRANFQPTPCTKICSDHFEDSCFVYQPFTNRRQLKPGSIPTIFVFSKGTSSRRIMERCPPTKRKRRVMKSETCKASTSTEADERKESTETWTEMIKESSKVSAETQIVSFSEEINTLAQKKSQVSGF
ncbi:hypothetical protein NPIL_338981 [Nephila pilipes]|uniref:THAP-type domain-containing protein n=1 Tax=Nephila pilipes TaxID=299642 RepID=A0A8X6T6X9_NEPPI|nr:hypothetical protein NPIL_338981 [Nephila pilipes]